MNYTKVDIERLITLLEGTGYDAVASYFRSVIEAGHLEFGLSIPGSMGSAIVLEGLRNLFPDAYHAMIASRQDLSLYIDSGIGVECPIALWRLGF